LESPAGGGPCDPPLWLATPTFMRGERRRRERLTARAEARHARDERVAGFPLVPAHLQPRRSPTRIAELPSEVRHSARWRAFAGDIGVDHAAQDAAYAAARAPHVNVHSAELIAPCG
jgi:hypothetical protein